MTPKTPLRHMGSKASIMAWLLPLFPRHDTYIDAFGGAAAVLLAKPPVKNEVYNDIDKEVYNLFRILRHPRLAARLAAMCALTPFSRAEFDDAKISAHNNTLDDARLMLLSRWARIHASNTNGFRFHAGKGHHSPADWTRIPQRILDCAERFRKVTVENLSWGQLIPHYDQPAAFIYCDPPYPAATRKSGSYAHEMSDDDHIRLCETLNSLKHAKWALSSYDNDIYNSHLHFARKYKKKTAAALSGERTEVLYTSYQPENYLF